MRNNRSDFLRTFRVRNSGGRNLLFRLLHDALMSSKIRSESLVFSSKSSGNFGYRMILKLAVLISTKFLQKRRVLSVWLKFLENILELLSIRDHGTSVSPQRTGCWLYTGSLGLMLCHVPLVINHSMLCRKSHQSNKYYSPLSMNWFVFFTNCAIRYLRSFFCKSFLRYICFPTIICTTVACQQRFDFVELCKLEEKFIEILRLTSVSLLLKSFWLKH